ncbi:MAG: 2-C-methyl-D-erythritol 4-phosphate cytidylyltransferase, partial [Eubacteriales bacterium]|nr:2-C-methyl-D-erythritol 4-phosphate cytidylyltransferase [Eubacteriales bacterium]
MAETYVIVLAAGDARRMGENKMFMRVGTMSVLERSLAAFELCGCFDRVVIVCKENDMDRTGAVAEKSLSVPYTLVPGGSERQFSVENALHSLRGAAGDDVVVVH